MKGQLLAGGFLCLLSSMHAQEGHGYFSSVTESMLSSLEEAKFPYPLGG